MHIQVSESYSDETCFENIALNTEIFKVVLVFFWRRTFLENFFECMECIFIIYAYKISCDTFSSSKKKAIANLCAFLFRHFYKFHHTLAEMIVSKKPEKEHFVSYQFFQI